MGVDEVTTGELARRMDRLEMAVHDVGGKLDQLVQPATYVSDKNAIEARLARVERRSDVADARAWQTRLAIVVAFLSCLLPIVLAYLHH